MSPGPADWLPGSFFRSPQWRWLRATWLHRQARRASPRIDDEWVRRAMRFLAATAGGPPKRRKGSAHKDTATAAALDLAQEQDPHRRWMVESLLLTAESLETIARRCELSVAVVEAYHELFFDVRPHLTARDWIFYRAVGASGWTGFAGQPLGALWRYAAFTAGPLALEVMVAVTMDQPLPGWLRAWFADKANPDYEEARFRFLARLTVAALTVRTPAQLTALVEARDRLRRMDQERGGTPVERPGLLPVMAQFLRMVGRSACRRKTGRKTATQRPRDGEHCLDLGGAAKPGRDVPAGSLP
jgi:hypothetical protein